MLGRRKFDYYTSYEQSAPARRDAPLRSAADGSGWTT